MDLNHYYTENITFLLYHGIVKAKCAKHGLDSPKLIVGSRFGYAVYANLVHAKSAVAGETSYVGMAWKFEVWDDGSGIDFIILPRFETTRSLPTWEHTKHNVNE
ncbi:hypothetical protein AVEN_175517-1 [Araneus ventricosus]|uniref:Uncharacterized protein n=1 Tax=Araneus ventricosus TaxID=182803 RepID=A0A4Y2CP17_ARAVE|nr:hypothetical protein AVEN_175517-1 [Araneus ventricosus]